MTDLILGIETSCDDTSIALVDKAGKVAALETVTQYDVHKNYGGVYPELASRAHLQAILPAIRTTLREADATTADIRAIGVTRGPGLMGSLLVGLSTAQALSLAWDKPAIGVNHLRGHIRSVDLVQTRLTYPALVVLVSGGHTLLALATDAWSLRLLGTTRDDSMGECYDKVARMLGLGMPGGPAIDVAARDGAPTISFPRPMLREGYEFSFSGLKSSVARHIEKTPDTSTQDVAASFVAACLDVVSAKIERAIAEFSPQCLAIVGGVAASPQLRDRMAALSTASGVTLCLPPQKWATDNGAMIALAAWDYIAQGHETDLSPRPNLRLDVP